MNFMFIAVAGFVLGFLVSQILQKWKLKKKQKRMEEANREMDLLKSQERIRAYDEPEEYLGI